MTRLDEMFSLCQEVHEMVAPVPLERFDDNPLLRMIPRGWAAEVLSEVAEHGSSGHFPVGITTREIGWALYRLLINAPGATHRDGMFLVDVDGVLQGLAEAGKWYATGVRPELVES